MAAAVSVTWNPSAVNSALARAFRGSAVMAAADAVKGNPAPSVVGVKGPIVKGATATIIGTGLAPVFEGGREAGYPIAPKRRRGGGVLKFTTGDGGFAAYATGGPMRAQPFLHPAAARWATIYYQQAARGALATVGAGAFAAAVNR